MHSTYTFFTALLMTYTIFGQDSFHKYENMHDVSSMVMDNNMFRLLSKIDFDNTDSETKTYLELIENIKNVKIFSSEKNAIRQTMRTDIAHYLQNAALEQLLISNENNQKVALHALPSETPNHVKKLLLFLEDNSEPNSQKTFIVFINGNINIKHLSKLTQDLEIPGSKSLKKLAH